MNNNKKQLLLLIPHHRYVNENFLWIPESITDNVVPGLNSLLTYIQSESATLTALQNSTININKTINNEIQNIQTEINNTEITNQQNVNNNLSYHTNHTDFMYQRNATKNGNRISFITQQNYFTYQRKGNQELQSQALNIIVSDLQNQMNNITSNNPPDNNDPDVGTM